MRLVRKPPDVVTVAGAAEILTGFLRENVALLASSGRGDLRRVARQARKDFRKELTRGVSPKQVRMLADVIAEPTRTDGASRLVNAVDLAFMGLLVQCRVLGIAHGARLWAGMASHAIEIRKALRHPASRLALQVDVFGRVSVVPREDADPEAFVFDLAEARADIDARLVKRRETRDFEFVDRWRRVPAKELRAAT
jgi:hypothetical protein